MAIVASLIEAIAGVVQGTLGFGVNAVAVPFLVMVNPHFAPVPVVIVSGIGSTMVLFRGRKEISWTIVRWGLLGRLPGTVAGVLIVALIVPKTLDEILGGCILLLIFLSVWRPPIGTSIGTVLVAGIGSGIAGTIGGLSGMPFGLALRELPGPVFRPTVAGLSLGGAVISMVGLGLLGGYITNADIILTLVLLPGLIAGFIGSYITIDKIKGKYLRYCILGIVTIGAVSVIVRAAT